MNKFLRGIVVVMSAAVLGIGGGCPSSSTVTVPDLAGQTQAAAAAALSDAGLTLGTVTQQYNGSVGAGLVTSQDPASGSAVNSGSSIAVVLSMGPQPPAVPNVAGMTQVSATMALINAGLIVGKVTNAYDATIPSGSVVSQNPAAGTAASSGMAVDLVLSKGPTPVSVPDVAGMTLEAARAAITAAGLTPGTVTQQYSPTVPAGNVIGQTPAAGADAAAGAAVAMVVSRGPQPVTVPNVSGMTQAAATTVITHAGLTVGAVTEQFSATVPSGEVISQTPAARDSAVPGAAVALVLSKGPQPVNVPNVAGMTQDAAGTALTNAGLTTGTVTQQYSATVPSGKVVSQNPAANASVLPGTAVALVLSKGPQPVNVPNVVGMTQTAAGTALTNAGLAAGTVTQQYSATVPSGSVISQNPAANASVLPGTTVALVISKGPQPVNVPNVVGKTQTAAGAALTNAGLATGTVTQQYSATVASGGVISQSPAAGVSVLPGTAVDLVVSKGPVPVTVPNVVGLTQAAAGTALAGAGLVAGAITQQYSATVAVGSVISQNPAASESVLPGTAVALVVSKGPAPVAVPFVVGLTQAAAESAITSLGLTVGAVTEEYSATVAAGKIISQTPTVATNVAPGTAVNLVVSKGPAPVGVPDVVGLAQADAETAITNAGLKVGTVTQQYSNTVPTGQVIDQTPIAGTSVAPGTAVDLVVSQGPAPVSVPDVVGLAQADAETAVTGANLSVGSITEQYSATAPVGQVVGQNPTAGTSVAPGTAVDLVLSKGPAPAVVPDVVGMIQADAETAITGAGLTVGSVTEQYSPTAPVGQVIDQTPPAGTGVELGTAVDLVLSKGPAPVVVPDLTGMARAGAEAVITDAGLVLGTVTEQYSDTVPAGSVISQTPTAGTSVAPGTAVDLVVSKGPAPVIVPNVTGMTQADAETTITEAGLTVGAVTEQYSDTVPAGIVISQAPPAGVGVELGTAVDLAVSKGPQSVAVPDVVGMTQADAGVAIAGAGLTFGTVSEEYSDTVASGSVIGQDPLAGVSVLPGTAINLVVSKGPHPVPVPDVTGMTQADAEAAIIGAGLTVGTVTEEYSGTVLLGSVISQTPPASESVAPGSPVVLVVSKGPAPVIVPDVADLVQAAAETAITTAGLTVGTVTEEYSGTVASGSVISQDPLAGVSVPSGTAVNLIVSKGPQPVPVPDVTGLVQADAQLAITAADLTVGTVTEEYSDTVASGSVISQAPLAGVSVLPGTAVNLVVSKGPQPVPVPDVTGMVQSDAEAVIMAANLTVGTEIPQYSDTIPVDSVISQTPAGGGTALPGTAVNLVVSKGPDTPPVALITATPNPAHADTHKPAVLTSDSNVLYGLQQSAVTGISLDWVDPADGSVTESIPVVLAGSSWLVTGGLGLAADPTTGTMWAVIQATDDSSVNHLLLAALDPLTGAAKSVFEYGVTDTQPNDLTFADDGTLYAVAQSSGSPGLYSVDKTSGALTGLMAFDTSGGYDAIAYVSGPGLLLHAFRSLGGDSTLEAVDPKSMTVIANLPPAPPATTYLWGWPTAMARNTDGTAFLAQDIALGDKLFTITAAGGGYYNGTPLAGATVVYGGLAFGYAKKAVCETVQLDGGTSYDTDPEDTIVSYAWSVTAVPAGSAVTGVSDPGIVNPTLVPDVFGDYTVELVVSDGTSSSTAAAYTVTYENSAPVANAGNDFSIVSAVAAEACVDGSASYDADYDPMTYSWAVTDGVGDPVTVTFYPSDTSAAGCFTFAVVPTPGVYTATLTVTEDRIGGLSSTDSVDITVTP